MINYKHIHNSSKTSPLPLYLFNRKNFPIEKIKSSKRFLYLAVALEIN